MVSTWAVKNPFRKGRFYVLPPDGEWATHFDQSLRKAISGEYSAIILPEHSPLHSDFEANLSKIQAAGLRAILQLDSRELHRFLAASFVWFVPERVSLQVKLNHMSLDWSWLRDWKKNDSFFHIVIHMGSTRLAHSVMDQIPSDFDEDLHFYFESTGANKVSPRSIARMAEKWREHRREIAWKSPIGIDIFEPRIDAKMELESLVEPIFERVLNSAPRASIVIPIYNNHASILNVLNHLLLQNLQKKEFQLVLVDDGSTDESLKLILNFAQEHDLDITVLSFPRPGSRKMGDSQFRAGVARNLGVKWARGEYLIFLDADILVPPRFIEKTLLLHAEYDLVQWRREYLKKSVSPMTAEYALLTSEDTYIPEGGYWHQFYATSESQGWNSLDHRWKYVCTYALSIKKSIFKQAGWFRKTYCFYGFEDTDLGWRLSSAGLRFYLHQQPVFHLYHETSRSEYKNSIFRRQSLLSKTAEIFYYNNLSPEIYSVFKSFLRSWF